MHHQCLINGQWVSAKDNTSITVINPSTQQAIGNVPRLSAVEIEHAVITAHEAWRGWREKTAKQRAQVLRNWFELIIENGDALAKILTLEQGKPIKEALGEIQYGASFVEWFSEEAKRIYGDVILPPQKNQHIIVLKQPVGVIAAITPWNFPCAMITRKCAPALAAGCTVVLKPSSLTPFTALALGELALRAGVPAGGLNIITGDAKTVGNVLAQHPLVRKVSFTGSTAVGKTLMQQAASTVKKVSLELGGNAPFIVFDDADIDAAVSGAMACKFRNAGQTCVCANRIFVHEKVLNIFADKFTAEVKKLTVGDGITEGVTLGPLINQEAVAKVEMHVADAISKGAVLLHGGKRHALGGTFFEPTVLKNVTPSAMIFSEETFGPVAPLFAFRDDAEIIELANATPYGLAAYFYSQNIHRIWKVAEQLEYGMIGINAGIISTEVAPFGGLKESGIGREGSKYGIHEFIEIKNLLMGAPA
jgi:succinate-semialdehyde dehydrogenase/glutarate-semialdehyde dehydrogenase